MKKAFDKERFIFYLWVAGAYLLLWLFRDLVSDPLTFHKRAVNNIWLISYLVVLNFIFFEYTLPFIRLTWQRLLIAPFLLFAHVMLYSFGFYGWRQLGIAVYIYFPLREHATIT